MKTTIKPYLLSRRKTADGLYPVYIRITQNRSYSLYSTEIYIKKNDWNKRGNYRDRNWIKGNHPSIDKWNNEIYRTWRKIEDIISENEGIHRKEIVNKLNDNTGAVKVYDFGIEYADKLKDDGKFNPYKQTRTALAKFKDYAGNLTFEEVTPHKLNEYQKDLAKDKRLDDGTIQKGNHPNTIASNMVKLKAVFREAHKQKKMKLNPFDDSAYQQTKEISTNKKALSIQQIEAIEGLELEKGSDMWHVRNYFMFSFWNAGIRFTDLAHLKWENIKDGRLTYKMGKTNSEKDILLTQPAKDILSYYMDEGKSDDDFIFPLLPEQKMTEAGYKKKANSKNVVVNRLLKDIQKLAGIDTNISFHISRHSFARWAKAKGLSLDFIGKALAHKKRATTEQYLDSLSEYDADSEMERLVNSRGKK